MPMRVAIPISNDQGLDSTIAHHFGRASAFAIVDTDNDQVQIRPNTGLALGGICAESLLGHRIQIVLCDDLGRGAHRKLKDLGAVVYTGARGSVRQAIAAWRAGRLVEVH